MPLTRNQQAALQANTSTGSVSAHTSDTLAPSPSDAANSSRHLSGSATDDSASIGSSTQDAVAAKTASSNPDAASNTEDQHAAEEVPQRLSGATSCSGAFQSATAVSNPETSVSSQSGLSSSLINNDTKNAAVRHAQQEGHRSSLRKAFDAPRATSGRDSNRLNESEQSQDKRSLNKEQRQPADVSKLAQDSNALRPPADWMNLGQGMTLSNDIFTQENHAMAADFGASNSLFNQAGDTATYLPQNTSGVPPHMHSGMMHTVGSGNPEQPQQHQQLQQQQQQKQQQELMEAQRRQVWNEQYIANLHAQMSASLSPDKHFQTPLNQHAPLLPVHNQRHGQRSNGTQTTPKHAHHPAAPASAMQRAQQDQMLGADFSVPATVPRAAHGHNLGGEEHHARNMSSDSIDALWASQQLRANQHRMLGFTPSRVHLNSQQHQQTPHHHRSINSNDSNTSMDVDQMEAMSNFSHHLSGSPVGRTMSDGRSVGREDARLMMRQNRSLGQMGAVMTGGNENMLRLSGGQLRPVDVSSFDRFKTHLQHSQQYQQQYQTPHSGSGPSSVRSLSPSDNSFGPGAMMGNISPHSSITTGRHAGDSSIDTSTDSISNSATTMSAVPSQASSISDDLLSMSSGSRRNVKGKTRLRNIDRKAICEAARNNPKIRQEDLAARFGIERSTVSKTLKNKEKWLAIDDDSDGAQIVKHRTGKFPEVEEHLFNWIQAEHPGSSLSDTAIRERSLKIAQDVGLSSDQFKASLGWIEKFRERYRILKPIVSEIELVNGTRRAQPFKSSVTLSTNYGDTGVRYLDEVGPSNMQQDKLQNIMPQAEGEEMTMYFSPPSTASHDGPHAVPTASTPQRPRSEEGGVAIHETPKASKRHYDDMSQMKRGHGSIDASLARMHLPESGSGSGTASEHSPGGSAVMRTMSDHGTLASGPIGLSSNAPKRRKGASSANRSVMNHAAEMDKHGSRAIESSDESSSVAEAREHSHRTRNQMFEAAGSQPTPQMAAAAVAAAQELRRAEDAHCAFFQHQRRGAEDALQSSDSGQQHGDHVVQHMHQVPLHQQQPLFLPDSRVESPALLGLHGLHRTTSHPAFSNIEIMSRHSPHARTPQGMPLDTPSPLRHNIPSGLAHSQSAAADLGASGSLLSAMQSSAQAHMEAGEDHNVTLEEARDSLDVLLSFIKREPATLTPSDYIFLGNLQATLNSYASNGGDSESQQQQQQAPLAHAHLHGQLQSGLTPYSPSTAHTQGPAVHSSTGSSSASVSTSAAAAATDRSETRGASGTGHSAR